MFTVIQKTILNTEKLYFINEDGTTYMIIYFSSSYSLILLWDVINKFWIKDFRYWDLLFTEL
jgi:hypothetical protein